MNCIPRRTSLVLVAALALAGLTLFPTHARAEDAPASQPAKKSVVDYNKLKELLPESLADMKRTGRDGQKTTVGEQSVSVAIGNYGDSDVENAPTGTISFMDEGTTEIAAGTIAMLNMEMDHESDDEWTKTTKLGEYKALLSFNKKDKRGSVQTIAGERIIVTLELRGVTEEQFKKAADELPLAKLTELVK